MTASLLEQLADLPKAEVDALIRAMAPGEANAFEYDWRYRARPEQLPPAGSWRVWLLTSGDEADETGIIVAGKDKNGHGYVLADLSGRYPPTQWARLAITAYRTHRADRIVAEVNNGGDMVGATLRMVDPNVAFTAVHGRNCLSPTSCARTARRSGSYS